MAAFLSVNGVTLPVAQDSARESIRSIGTDATAYSGSAIRQRIATKYDLEVETTPLSASEAFAWAGLIRGEGHHFCFDSHLYSDKGLVPAVTTGNSVTAAEKRSGAGGLQITAGSSFDPADWYNTATGCTVVFFYQATAGAGFTHYVVTESSGGTNYYWTNGASKTAGTPTPTGLTVGISAGDLSLAASGATRYVDDLVLLPFVVPDSWVSSIYTFHAAGAWSSIPRLTLAGDAIWEASSRTVIGFCEASSMLSGYLSGSFAPNLRKLSVLFKGA